MLVWWAELSVTHLPLYRRGVYCHSERQLHLHTTCSLSISHSRTQPPSPLLQRLTPQETQTARTHKRRHALHRGTIKTSQSIRESETWKAFWKFELFLSSLLATLSVFTCLPSPGRGFDKRCASKIGFMIIWLWGIRCVFVSSAISELCFHSYAFLYNSLNNKEQPVNPHTEYRHWTLRVPLHRLQL